MCTHTPADGSGNSATTAAHRPSLVDKGHEHARPGAPDTPPPRPLRLQFGLGKPKFGGLLGHLFSGEHESDSSAHGAEAPESGHGAHVELHFGHAPGEQPQHAEHAATGLHSARPMRLSLSVGKPEFGGLLGPLFQAAMGGSSHSAQPPSRAHPSAGGGHESTAPPAPAAKSPAHAGPSHGS